jgi:hypothetical protein
MEVQKAPYEGRDSLFDRQFGIEPNDTISK